MTPTYLTEEEYYSLELENDYRSGKVHLVCIAETDTGFSNFDAFTKGLIKPEEADEIIKKTNEELSVSNLFPKYKLPLSVLPVLEYEYKNDTGDVIKRDLYEDEKFIYKLVLEVFKINKTLINAPQVTFLFEAGNFNSGLGIDALHLYTALAKFPIEGSLKRISYFQSSFVIPRGVWI